MNISQGCRYCDVLFVTVLDSYRIPAHSGDKPDTDWNPVLYPQLALALCGQHLINLIWSQPFWPRLIF